MCCKYFISVPCWFSTLRGHLFWRPITLLDNQICPFLFSKIIEIFTFSLNCSVNKSYLTPVTPWTAAFQASLSFTISLNLLKFMSIESVKPSNRLILSCLLLHLPSIFSSIRVFSSESVFLSGDHIIGASASALALLMIIQGWLPLGLTGLISLQSKGLSRVFSITQFESISSSALSLL